MIGTTHHTETVLTRACPNKVCSRFEQPTVDSFCPNCGQTISVMDLPCNHFQFGEAIELVGEKFRDLIMEGGKVDDAHVMGVFQNEDERDVLSPETQVRSPLCNMGKS